MVKKGPCRHCGIESTPLWRNGPPEKPVLCNACGSRFRLCATLDNYTPKHAQPLNHIRNLIKHHHNPMITHPTTFTLNSMDIVSPQAAAAAKETLSSSKKRAQMEAKNKKELRDEMNKFQKQMVSLWKQNNKRRQRSKKEEEAANEVLIMNRLNAHIVPSNEIGLGIKLLPTQQPHQPHQPHRHHHHKNVKK